MMDPIALVLVAAAGIFAVINGINDGGALISIGLKMPVLRPWLAVVMMTGALALVPLVVGTAVASTLAGDLVTFTGSGASVAILAALVSSGIVVHLLSRRGIPTSLTLALIGGLTGAGIGSGLTVSWRMVGAVLVVAAVAPMLGAVLAYLITGVIRRLPSRPQVARSLPGMHVAAFALVCIAYGANDGQKMLAVAALSYGGVGVAGVGADVGLLVSISVLFALGAILGVRRLGTRFGTGVLAVRPVNTVAAELASATAVLGSASFGAPVSMTQALTGGLVGTGVTDGLRRIRWSVATSIVIAWLVTLPLSLAAAVLLSLAARPIL